MLTFAPLLFGTLGTLAAVRFAPNVPAGTWRDDALPVPFVLVSPSGDDALAREAAAEIDVALRTWSRPPCTRWRARFGGVVPTENGDDGLNAIVIHRDHWPIELLPRAVAQTVVRTDAQGHYREADIHVNAVDYAIAIDGGEGLLDLRSIVVHELGHALGLGHSGDPTATMYEAGSGQRWRSLEADDVAGVCSLYPGVGDDGCDATPCPASYTCVAGACQRPGSLGDVCAPCDGPADCEAAGTFARCVTVTGGAGRACGRRCEADDTCGHGFRCLPTSTAGDKQCVADDGCRASGNHCSLDADCRLGRCEGGVCLGAPPADAGSNIDAGEPTDAPAPPAEDPGCAMNAASSSTTSLVVLLGLLGVMRCRRRSPARR